MMFVTTSLGNAATPVGTCTEISLSGEYVLTANIANTSVTSCISINASNVTFDGAGFTITGGGSGNGVFVHNPSIRLTNVTISNLKVTNWHRGIDLWYSDNSIVEGNTASNNDYGIYIDSSDNNMIEGNTAPNNDYGIYIDSSDNNIIEGNTASNDDLYGIELLDSSKSIVENNSALNNNYGIDLWSSSDSTVSGNDASNNDYGIYLQFSDNSEVINNTASNNFLASIELLDSSNIKEKPATAASNNSSPLWNAYHGIPSFSLFTYSNDLVVNAGETVSIEMFISGVGDVEANKLVFTVPPNIIEGENITETYYFPAERTNETPTIRLIHSGTDFYLEKEYFMYDSSKSGVFMNFGEETHGGEEPLNLSFTINSSAPPGDYVISTVLFYKSGSQWYQSERNITIHIRSFFEQNMYLILVLFLSVLGIILNEEFVKVVQGIYDRLRKLYGRLR